MGNKSKMNRKGSKKDSIEKAAGAGVSLMLGGKEYKIKPFGIGDYIALRGYIKSQRIKDFLGSADGLPELERTKILVELSSQTISEMELMDESITPNGMLFMVWRALRKSNSDLTLEDMDDLIDDESMGNLMAVAKGLNEEDDPNPPVVLKEETA